MLVRKKDELYKEYLAFATLSETAGQEGMMPWADENPEITPWIGDEFAIPQDKERRKRLYYNVHMYQMVKAALKNGAKKVYFHSKEDIEINKLKECGWIKAIETPCDESPTTVLSFAKNDMGEYEKGLSTIKQFDEVTKKDGTIKMTITLNETKGKSKKS